jgi:hypothetical protein
MILASSIAAPAVSQATLTKVFKWSPDGSVEEVYATVLDGLLPPPLPALGSTDQEPGAAPPPDESGSVDKEKARPTRMIDFYGHVFGLGMIAPASTSHEGEFGPDGPQPSNTIYPRGDGNLGLGFNDLCADALPPVTVPVPLLGATGNTGPCDTDPNNKLSFFLTAGPVQVHQRDDFVYSKLHNEHGRTKDVVLDTAQNIKAGMWMSLDLFGWQVGNGGDDTYCVVHLPPDMGCPYPYWGWDPAVWPSWVVEATLYSVELGDYGQGASEPPPIFEKWASQDMQVIAHGALAPADVTNGLPGADNVHYFEVDMGPPQVDVIPKTHDIVLVFSFYSVINGQKIAPGQWRVWGGELFPTKFTLPVKNPLDVELVIPQFVHDKLLVHSVIGSAWGSYDVDIASAKVTVLDSGQRPVDMVTVQRVGDYQVAHGAHFKPVNITWIWDYKADKLRPGDYKIIVDACNLQHTACESTEAGFSIGADLLPTDVRVGRQGQRTASEGQLAELTGTPSNGGGFSASDDGGFSLPFLLGQRAGAALPKSMAPGGDAPLQEQKSSADAARPLPGFEPLFAFLIVAGVALALRRRWS